MHLVAAVAQHSKQQQQQQAATQVHWMKSYHWWAKQQLQQCLRWAGGLQQVVNNNASAVTVRSGWVNATLMSTNDVTWRWSHTNVRLLDAQVRLWACKNCVNIHHCTLVLLHMLVYTLFYYFSWPLDRRLASRTGGHTRGSIFLFSPRVCVCVCVYVLLGVRDASLRLRGHDEEMNKMDMILCLHIHMRCIHCIHNRWSCLRVQQMWPELCAFV